MRGRRRCKPATTESLRRVSVALRTCRNAWQVKAAEDAPMRETPVFLNVYDVAASVLGHLIEVLLLRVPSSNVCVIAPEARSSAGSNLPSFRIASLAQTAALCASRCIGSTACLPITTRR